MVWLRLVHIVAGIVWVGSAVFAALFLFPTARAVGPDGRRFIERLQRRMGPAFGIAMLLTVIPGFVMYGRLSAGFNRAWVTSRPGLALGAGAVATLLAVVIGIASNAPADRKIARLRQGLEQQGSAPTAAQAAELAALQTRIERGTQVAAALLLLAAGAMAVARYL
ncbi:MAG: hypothetical protein DMD44_14055 [Gemmatimonadetes bacterium]|nr:MAG: hypothetical protein DMD44_14055 [Gemmatimonadota bacterium]